MQRTLAIVERELRRFRRSPTLIIVSMVFPIVQLVVLGYAFGGSVKHLKVGIVDQDHGLSAVKVQELAARSRRRADVRHRGVRDHGQALDDLRNGRINGVLTIPPEFSRRVLEKNEPRIALIEDNTDNFVAATLAASIGGLVSALNQPVRGAAGVRPGDARRGRGLPVRAVHSVPAAGIDRDVDLHDGHDRRRHHLHRRQGARLHEGYLVTPITKLELIAGFNLSGTIKAVLAGMMLMTLGSLIAGIPNPFDPMRLLRLVVVIVVTALALISLMFLMMVRVNDPLVPRATFGVLNTLLYFPSGAVYPQQAFPRWMQAIAIVDPFTYAVHAFKSLLLKNTGFGAIRPDLAFLLVFSAGGDDRGHCCCFAGRCEWSLGLAPLRLNRRRICVRASG